MTWQERAACVGSPHNFTPADDDEEAQRQAARVCVLRCPVRAECHAFATDDPHAHGVYAGRWFANGREVRVVDTLRHESLAGRGRNAEHGTWSRYRSGCRCDPCRTGYRTVERERSRRKREAVA